MLVVHVVAFVLGTSVEAISITNPCDLMGSNLLACPHACGWGLAIQQSYMYLVRMYVNY